MQGGKEAENPETNESQENQRSTVKKQAKSNKIDHIMIVDSMARYLDPGRLYKSKKTIIRKLKNGKVKAAVGAAEELLELKHTAVTLVLDTEELRKGSAASVITDMKEVTAVIKKVFPHSTVLISEVMPYPSPKNLQRKAEYVNKALGIWGKSMEWIKVIEHNSLWENKNLFEKPNIHLTESEGTAALVTNLKHVLNPVLGLPPYYIKGRKQAENTTKKYPVHYHVSKFQRQTCKITDEEVHASVETPSNVYKQKCISLITKIVNDKDHYLHNLITVLPHGHLRAIKCTTERSRKTFLPVAVKLFNAK